MDGLECSEKLMSEVIMENKVFRFDAEYFDKKCLFLLDKIKSGHYMRIENNFDVSKLAGFEYTEYFTSTSMNSEDSYIALTSKNIQQNRLSLNEYITIDKKVADKYLMRSKLKKGDVVLSYTGEYRRALVLFDEGFQLGPNVCRLTPTNNAIDSGFLSVFLNSKSGQKILDREKTLSAQPTVAMSRIRTIPVPIFSTLQKCISRLVVKNHNLMIESNNRYQEATTILKQVIKGEDYNTSNVSIKNVKDSLFTTGRFDAEFYQYKYELYEKSLNTCDTISSLCELYDKSFTPCETSEYRYIELANVGVWGNITDVETFSGNMLPSRARRIVKKGNVIISSVEGSLQKCALVTDEFDNAICSTGFYVLESNFINSETLLVLFKSKSIQALLKQRCSGAILSGITKDELLNMPFPKIAESLQEKIAEKVKESFALRKYAEKLIEYAKKAIDIAVEQDEATAIKWLKEREVE